VTTAAERLAKRRADAALRPAIDLTSQITSDVMDQGPRPTCLPCAIAAAHEAERSGFGAAVEPIWWRLRSWHLADEDGTTLRSAGRALSDAGHCESHLWPYNNALGFDTEPPPVAAGNPPWMCADLLSVAIAHDGVEDVIEDELAVGHPIALVLEVSAEFEYPEPDGFIPVPPITAPTSGYHAVLIVGAWTDPNHGRVFLIRNSWGKYWAVGGYGLLPVEYLIGFGAEAAKVAV
jgi:Papain family cysteine protease